MTDRLHTQPLPITRWVDAGDQGKSAARPSLAKPPCTPGLRWIETENLVVTRPESMWSGDAGDESTENDGWAMDGLVNGSMDGAMDGGREIAVDGRMMMD